jgi:hypothetical protein
VAFRLARVARRDGRVAWAGIGRGHAGGRAGTAVLRSVRSRCRGDQGVLPATSVSRQHHLGFCLRERVRKPSAASRRAEFGGRRSVPLRPITAGARRRRQASATSRAGDTHGSGDSVRRCRMSRCCVTDVLMSKEACPPRLGRAAAPSAATTTARLVQMARSGRIAWWLLVGHGRGAASTSPVDRARLAPRTISHVARSSGLGGLSRRQGT